MQTTINQRLFAKTCVCEEGGSRIVQQSDRSGSSRCAMIVAEHSSESLAPDDWVMKFANGGDSLQQPVAESLIISLAVIMAEILCNSAPLPK
jgi:hypothetical protein